MKIRKALIAVGLALCCIFNTACKGKVLPGNLGITVLEDGDLIAVFEIENYGTIKAKLLPDIAPQAVENFQKLVDKGYYNGLNIHCVLKDNRIQGGSLNGDGTGGNALINQTGYFPNEISPNARHFYGALCYANENGKNTTQFYIVNSKQSGDLSKYSVDKIKEKAATYTAKKETLESTDPEYESVAYLEEYYTQLASMIGSAPPEVSNKYLTGGGVPMWDGGSTVFGQVYEGLDVVDKISAAAVTTDNNGEECRPVEEIIIKSVTYTKYESAPAETESSSKKGSKKK